MPSKKRISGTLIIWLVLSAEVILFFAFAFILTGISGSALNKMPEQTAQVEVVKKSIHRDSVTAKRYRVCFKFKDGMEKIFVVDFEMYETLRENDTGTLFYKEVYRGGRISSVDDRAFVRFEKAPPE